MFAFILGTLGVCALVILAAYAVAWIVYRDPDCPYCGAKAALFDVEVGHDTGPLRTYMMCAQCTRVADRHGRKVTV